MSTEQISKLMSLLVASGFLIGMLAVWSALIAKGIEWLSKGHAPFLITWVALLGVQMVGIILLIGGKEK